MNVRTRVPSPLLGKRSVGWLGHVGGLGFELFKNCVELPDCSPEVVTPLYVPTGDV